MKRIIWTAVGAVIAMVAALAVVLFVPNQDALALVLIGSSISLSVLSLREA